MQEETRVRRLVVGLGNPGPDYDGTRHNVGFDVLDHLARHEGLLFESPAVLEDYHGPRELVCARSFEPDALLVKPLTFMNRSGDVVAPLARWAGVEPQDVMVVYDDLDLPFSTLRIRPHGGAGGHNGMRSILERLGSDRFPRLRVGIGHPGTDAARHVLSRFTSAEEEDIAISVAEAAEAILAWLAEGDVERVMTRFHSRWSEGSKP
ncbi:MAG: aminoacyl-tRNA hydrolase [Planctomycetota bacterium]